MFTLRYQGGDPVLVGAFYEGAYDEAEQWSCQHAQTARSAAGVLARRIEQSIQVMRGAKVSYIMMPDGRVGTPEGMIAPDRMNCTRDSGRPCFCQPCRDDRKAARR